MMIDIIVVFMVIIFFGVIIMSKACQRANRVEWDISWMNWVDGFNRLFCYRYHRLNVMSLKLPKQGAAIVVSNHVSGLDPLLLMASSRRRLRFLIAREEYERFGLNWLFKAVGCIPVDRKGNAQQAFRDALQALEQGEVVALFPHGYIHLDSEPFRRIKGGAVRLSKLSQVDIYPYRIEGIKGQGHVTRGVIYRSTARLQSLGQLSPSDFQKNEMGKCLQAMLDGADVLEK